MAKFRFAFETLLKQRCAAEDVAQRDLARVLRQRMILMGQLRAEQRTVVDAKRDLVDGLVGRVDVGRVSQFAHFSGQVTQRAQAVMVSLASVETRIVEARAKLNEAMRARKTIELLRQRRLELFKRQQQRRETAQLDEMAIQVHLRGDMMGAGT